MNQEDEKIRLLAEQWMNDLETKIIYLLERYYGKPYTLDKRVKSTDKLKLKQGLLSNKRGYLVPIEELPDIVGFRISVENDKDVEIVSEIIKYFMLPDRVVDFFNKPKDTGFKAYLYYFKNFEVNTEIQIMTKKMKEWTNETHDEHNKRKYNL